MVKKLIFLGVIFTGLNTFANHNFSEQINLLKMRKTSPHAIVIKVKSGQLFGASQNHLRTLFGPNLNMKPLFPNLRKKLEVANSGNQNLIKEIAEISSYFYVNFTSFLSPNRAAQLLQLVYSEPSVEFAYFPPELSEATVDLNQTPPQKTARNLNHRSSIPNFESLQYYLNPSPLGLDARFMWSVPGGTGKNVHFFDIEGGWFTQNSELSVPFYQNGFNLKSEHGTAVWGEVAGKRDGAGITGFAYDVSYGLVSHNVDDSHWGDLPTVLEKTLDDLVPFIHSGDIFLLEVQGQGPNGRATPVEYWQGIFDVLKTMSRMGALCVEAAGNGANNLDSSMYGGVFDLRNRDSGCLMIGAGGAPGTNYHQRLSFSNYGSRIDAFGYGENVVTTGYGDLFTDASSPHVYDYTAVFKGTSSASAMVAGAVASLQGAAKACGRSLNYLQLRAGLRSTGAPQQGNITEPIGNLPDLRALAKYFQLFAGMPGAPALPTN